MHYNIKLFKTGVEFPASSFVRELSCYCEYTSTVFFHVKFLVPTKPSFSHVRLTEGLRSS